MLYPSKFGNSRIFIQKVRQDSISEHWCGLKTPIFQKWRENNHLDPWPIRDQIYQPIGKALFKRLLRMDFNTDHLDLFLILQSDTEDVTGVAEKLTESQVN